MQILCVGCSGFIGKALRARLLGAGHVLIVVSRQKQIPVQGETWVPFESDWMEHLRHVDAFINFAGESIAQWPYTQGRKALIRETRAGLCRRVVDRLARFEARPKIWINASAVGIYGDRGDESLPESAEYGASFLSSVCHEWEAEVIKASKLGVREVRLRLGVVLGPGGVLAQLQKVYRLRLGGLLGNGVQYFPWVHRDDVVRSVLFALENPLDGAFNVVSPGIVTQGEFSKSMSKILGVFAVARVPAFVLRILLGDMSELLLSSQRAVPQNLTQSHFQFEHSDLEKTLAEFLKQV